MPYKFWISSRAKTEEQLELIYVVVGKSFLWSSVEFLWGGYKTPWLVPSINIRTSRGIWRAQKVGRDVKLLTTP